MNVSQIMSKKVVTVELDDKLSAVKEVFDNMRFHHVLAVENGELLGIVSDRDLLKAISPYVGTLTETHRDAATLNKRVHQVMSHHPIALQEDASIDTAIELFNQHKISCIPVVDTRNRPVGIISWRDIMKLVRKDSLELPTDAQP